jgi:hypothetical protein
MRDDEDHIRQFMPVLRRIIILVAVLTAIPVVMWTITVFVRTYVGPPKTPTFQHIAEATPAGSTPDASAAAPSDNRTTGSTQTSPPPIVEARAAATDADANAPAPDPNAAATPASGAANAASPEAAAPNPPDVAAPNPSPSPAEVTQTDAATKDMAPANATFGEPLLAPPATAATAPGAADTADVATPGPRAYAAPSEAPDGGVQVAAQQPAPTNWPTEQPPAVESLPPGEPVAGVVPLPRKRPKTFVLAQGPVPLPMPRPDAAGAGAPPAPSTPFDWLQHVFHAASDGAAPPASGDNNSYPEAPH